MGDIADQGSDWLRDFVTDGVPSSGLNAPEKSAGRVLFDLIDSLIADAGASHAGATAPSDAVYGTLWLDIVHDELNVYDGASWVTLFTINQTAHTAALAATVELPSAINFLGAWSSGTTYAVGDSASYDGGSYVSRVASNLNHQPDTSTTQWQVMAAQGDAGPVSLDKYVSETDGGDSGAGTIDDPYATWSKAYAETPAGATIWLYGTSDAPQTYKDTVHSDTAIDKEITIRALNKHGAIITSNGASNAAVRITQGGGETVTIIGCVIDPSPNESSTLAYCIQLDSETAAYRLNCIDCLFQGWTGASSRAVYTTDATFKGYLQFTRCDFVGDDCESGVRLETLSEGGIELKDCTFAIADQNTVSNGPIRIIGNAAGVYARILNCTADVTVKASLTGAGIHYGFYIQGVEAAKISGGGLRYFGPGSSRSVYGAMIQTNGAGDETELSIDDAVIENISIYCEPSGGGIAAGIGNDGAGDNDKMNRAIMRRVRVSASRAAAESGGIHGIFFGHVTDGNMEDNETDCVGFNGFKNTIDCNARRNRLLGSTSKAFNFKGAVGGTVADNTCTARPGSAMTMFALTQDPTSTIYTADVTIAQNYCVNEGNSSVVMVNVEAGNSYTAFTNNSWGNLVGALQTNVFRDGATNYTTFAGWHGAVGTSDVANFA